MLTKRNVITLLVSLGLAWGAATASAQSPAPLKVVASFSILGDFVKNVGGDRVDVVTLVGPNGDAHVFQPSPADARTVASARLVFVNGLGFEGGIERLIKSSGTKAAVVVATKGIRPRHRDDDEPPDHDEAGKTSAGGAHGHGHGHDHDDIDPHAWQSVANVKVYVANIRDALVKADPDGKTVYEGNAAAYVARLDALDAEVKAAMSAIPEPQRRIITSHDAFGYFGEAYGLKLIAPEGMSTEAEASAKDIAAVIRQIKAEKIPAVFIENITDPRLVEQVARESGAKVGGTLYSDALSEPGTDGGTYIDLMRHNIRELASALTR